MDSQQGDDRPRIGRLRREGEHEVWRSLWTYCTSLFVDRERPAYRGSGTFVRVRGVPCLLTAAHVWEELAKEKAVGFVLDNDRALQWVPIEALQERHATKRGSNEWGPDIAVVSFHQRDVRRLESEKAFYRLDRQRPLSGDPNVYELWAVVGASAELSTFNPTEALLKNHMVASTQPRHLTHEGLDYVEIPYGDTTPPEDIPSSWGGLSGAGLWRCELIPGATQADLEVVPILSGVAFYQHAEEPRRGAIRCHGPKSVYEYGLDHVNPTREAGPGGKEDEHGEG